MNRYLRTVTALAACALLLGSCSTAGLRRTLTRTESDTYTHIRRDTTQTIEFTNAPGERGVIYPSDRTVKTERTIQQYDSTAERHFPNFIRFGVFESAGLLATGPSDRAVGGGIFGIFTDPNESFGNNITPKSALFTGSMYRFGTVELPLYWFDDAPTWSVGTSVAEIFQWEASNDRAIVGALPLYFRKRLYVREEIPYFCITGAVGFGFLPSQYLNLSASFDAGSLGGINVRTYGGVLIGRSIEQRSVVQPYLGFGVSLLDFLNHPRELRHQWKDHEHSSWDVGLLRLTPFLLLSGGDTAARGQSIGMQLQVMPATVGFPVGDHRICVGVDLWNFVFAFRQQQQANPGIGFGYGVLPLRVGYWMPIADGALAIEPYAMYSYFPHSMWQVAARLHLNAVEWLPVGVTLGYISSAGFTISRGTIGEVVGRNILAFNVAYLGITIGIAEELFRPSQLRYYRTEQ
ncbi:MAG: hypothetical protein N2663_07610 [Chlorobi bacterium]|nr:hypothetical protein [Chlorobiota bacterium]